MNGLAVLLIAVMLFWSAAEQAAPGVTLASVTLAAQIYSAPNLPQALAAATAALPAH